ncbi:bifunctional D-glycero-beta-D-manno-heptose-7-phosphate kinase/D-glycero-beta-D-manno-heptose 1-phosphate adenylyltransferase HldE [Sulfuriflexus mobilis]|uniref:bifunctional D-glycero-beta-D-manno-heptose-7-phosphate kinase/D-glycero-beta-D-manno-heptose 1-phosphate adenylyltransferase HldE n=1 Tax=Sulfuriflexus mobilis TaxID=1811807 RepID=UPI000F836EB8|nr:bifunctional D-glycero-beta-D-manno-heptose-7-phosphate kinase/D-glycero-beta-D-manno-heptose 1-phosphate adenylyltransferase HldE [Sulfuriflexus mobilis]
MSKNTKVSLPDFSKAHVLVIGDIMLDRYWHGDTSRISPEAPVPVVRVADAEERPGGAANVALNIVALGASVTLLGVTGNDEPADTLQQRLEDAGVECHFLRLTGQPTITKLRVLSRHQQLIRLDFEDGFAEYNPEDLLLQFRTYLADVDVVLLSDYGKGTLRGAPALIESARTASKPVLVDPKGMDFDHYHGASLITPNLSEFEGVVGPCADDIDLAERGEALCRRLGLDSLLVTRSDKGMSLLRPANVPVHIPTQAREVYDVTGAGDTVIAALAASMAAGQSAEQAMSIANLAAGIVVGKLGTATASVAEIRRALYSQQTGNRGSMDEDSLLQIVEDARAHGERVVMTNGCFDILHAGHVGYLEAARKLGDRLIIAVNDDDSVRRLKGEERPINPLEQRMTVLAGLGCVDWVVAFSEDTPERLICKLLPDLLVKGGDYRPEDIAGGQCVQDNGGEVIVLDYEEGVSTTRMVEAIRGQVSEGS